MTGNAMPVADEAHRVASWGPELQGRDYNRGAPARQRDGAPTPIAQGALDTAEATRPMPISCLRSYTNTPGDA